MVSLSQTRVRMLRSNWSRFPSMAATVGTSLDRPLIESIDTALSALGTSTRDSVLLYLRRDNSFFLRRTLRRLDNFFKPLMPFFGTVQELKRNLLSVSLVK